MNNLLLGSIVPQGCGAGMQIPQSMNNLLENLNKEQLAAVRHKDGPLLIVAGAGTGKTTVITQRIAYLIEQDLAKGDEILALTFTEKAAGQMADRAGGLLPYGYFDLWISTFHSFAERILKEHGLAIGLSTDFQLLNEFEQWVLIKKNLDKFALDYYRPLGNPTKFIRALVKHFSRAKDEDISPRQYLEYADGLKQNLDGMLSGNKARSKKLEVRNKKSSISFCHLEPAFLRGQNDKVEEQEVLRLNEVANAFHVYQQLLLDNNALDFGDLINYCLKLFRERPAILEQYRRQFKYILLDEFQDTNWAQYELIKILAAPKNNLVVVGDDDQCLPGSSLILTKRGEKRIDKIAAGELVATAVGKGYLSYSPVKRVVKNKKKVKLITFTTAGGAKITATDNHKMFCHVPSWFYAVPAGKIFYYVYLMNKQELGWRLGMTNNLATRLKLERSADRIVALCSFSSEEEARYQETLLSLKYGIPTVCFQERPGIMTKRIWSEKLYQDLNVEAAAVKLANDFGINLSAHQVCLEAVNRGHKVRIKINLEMCVRNYRSKYAKGIFLTSPKILHQLTVETSHQPTIKILKKLGFCLQKSKKGRRLRLASADLPYLGLLARQIEQATGGIIENSFKVGSANIQHKKALIVPAGNILPGMYLPVVENKKIVYQQIIDRREQVKTMAVYDLEVAPTHNFVADRVIVHNSIFRFRGASMSNILQFVKDYPKTKKIILVKNYRSEQNILDLSYEFIKQNNPNRLEYQLENPPAAAGPCQGGGKAQAPSPNGQKLNKKLIAENKSQGEIKVIQGADLAEEVRLVTDKIIELKNKDKSSSWNDFAVLVRANDSARDFIAEFERRGLPYIFGAARGLYAKPLIMDAIAYFKLLDNYHESRALWRVLNLPVFKFTYQELVNFNHLAAKKAWSLYEVINNGSALQFANGLEKKIKPVLALIGKHSAAAREKTVSEIFLTFMNDSGYLKYLTSQDDKKSTEAANLLNQFMKRIQAFEAGSDDKTVKAFLEELTLEQEAGEEGILAPDLEAGPEAIKILTVHGAKGLEFKYVFIANLVDKRFPTIERGEQINLPDALVKEILPEGDVHLAEERRLFYVAMTRAKAGLYFSWASDYGGKIKKKPSRFLIEIGMVGKVPLNKGDRGLKLIEEKSIKSPLPPDATVGASLFVKGGETPTHFSYSQLAAYSACPCQYRFAHILKIPVMGKEQFSFGKTLHATLQKLFALLNEKKGLGQAELFNSLTPNPSSAHSSQERGVSFEEVLKLYEQSWVDDWFESKKKKQERKQQGQEILHVFYHKHKDNWPDVLFLEKSFSVPVPILSAVKRPASEIVRSSSLLSPGDRLSEDLATSAAGRYVVRGVIDRIDQAGVGIKLVDYKTGQPKEKLSFEDKEQLLIYQLAAGELFKQEVKALAFYYLDNNSEVEFIGQASDLEKIKVKIISTVKQIRQGQFPPKPGRLCVWCDYKEICEFKK